MSVSYDYFDHEADIGIIGRGDSITESFEAAAAAVFLLISPDNQVQNKVSCIVEFEETDQELALVTWLNLLIAEAQAKKLIFKQFKLEHDSNKWRGEAWGEHWRNDLERGTDVKGATLSMLSVKQKSNGEWESRCIVDV